MASYMRLSIKVTYWLKLFLFTQYYSLQSA